MSKQLLFGLIKFLMLSMPFLSLMIMILALWGVVGKTTYTDLDAVQQGIAFSGNEAKNYLVNETKKIEQCAPELKSTDVVPEGEEPTPKRTGLEHVEGVREA